MTWTPTQVKRMEDDLRQIKGRTKSIGITGHNPDTKESPLFQTAVMEKLAYGY